MGHTELALYRAMEYVERGCQSDAAKDMQQVRLMLEYSQGVRGHMVAALDRSSYFLREEPRYGGENGASMWIMPKGFYWTIEYANHSSFVYDVLGLEYHECEALGWIHLSGGRADAYTDLTSFQQRCVADLESAGHIYKRNFKERGDCHYKQRSAPDQYGSKYVRFNRTRKANYDWRDPVHWQKPLNEYSTFMQDTQYFLDNLAHNAAYSL